MIWSKGRRCLMGLKSPRNLLLLWKLRTWRRREWFSLLEETFWIECGSNRNCVIQFFLSVLFLHSHEPSTKCTRKHTEGDNFQHSFLNFCDTQEASINVVNSQKLQVVYVKRNIKARSCNHSCSRKTIINTYSESACL